MNITIDLQDFLNVVTYNGVCDGQNLWAAPAIAKIIEQTDVNCSICKIEWIFDDSPVIWSVEGWIAQCRRRQHLADESERMAKITAERIKNPPPPEQPIHKTRAQIIKENKKKSKRESALEDLLNNFGIKL